MINHPEKINRRAFVSEKFWQKTFSAESLLTYWEPLRCPVLG